MHQAVGCFEPHTDATSSVNTGPRRHIQRGESFKSNISISLTNHPILTINRHALLIPLKPIDAITNPKMGESAPSADGETSSDPSKPHPPSLPNVVNVTDTGDIILSVTFETSPETLKKSRKAALTASHKPLCTNGSPAPRQPILKPKVTIAYRVSLDMLKKHSKYFANLLTNPAFSEAKLISTTLADLASRKVKPSEADPAELPRVKITDDDEATQSAGREHVFEDMLRIIHQVPVKTTRVVMTYVSTLAILADRFDCGGPVSRALTDIKFKWPLTNTRPYVDEAGRVTETEKVLRQKILVSWLLGQPMRLHQASRELILRGSRLWSPYGEEEDLPGAWWNLPEGIEGIFSLSTFTTLLN